jgi:hypothetical protein
LGKGKVYVSAVALNEDFSNLPAMPFCAGNVQDSVAKRARSAFVLYAWQ